MSTQVTILLYYRLFLVSFKDLQLTFLIAVFLRRGCGSYYKLLAMIDHYYHHHFHRQIKWLKLPSWSVGTVICPRSKFCRFPASTEFSWTTSTHSLFIQNEQSHLPFTQNIAVWDGHLLLKIWGHRDGVKLDLTEQEMD